MRIRIHGVVLSVVGLIALAIGAFFLIRWRDAGAVDTWIGKQVLGVVESYLEPRIDFASLRYRSPRTVELRGVTLTSPDGARVTDIGLVTMELVRSPVLGQPIQVRKIVVTGAAVHLIETEPGRFKGLRPFLRATPGKETQRKIPKDFQLSTVLHLDKVEIRDASLHYAPADGSPPMVLDGLTLDLNVTEAPSNHPGWYGIDTSFGRYPQCTVSVNGAINLDTLVAELDSGELKIDLNPATIGSLPPRIQKIMRTYDAQGRFSMAIKGTIPLLNAMAGDLTCNIAVDSFRVASGDYVFPIETGTAALTFSDGEANLISLVLHTLGGEMLATAIAQLGRPDRRTDATWQIDRVDLRALLLAGSQEGKPPKLAGILNAHGQVRTSLDSPIQSISGAGQVSVREGRLLIIPGLKEMAEFFNAARGQNPGDLSHRAVAAFDVTPAGIVITKSEVVTEFALARGTGLVGFDKRLDLLVNAGPLEKLQSFLGAFGRAFGKLTDRLVTYHVHGRIGDAKVDVLPLGMGS